jgi:hypothetical protein
MAFQHSPKIVTNGLVLALDAGNHMSYPGSGTTWTDLSGNINNGTLTNGPTFNSGNGGSIVFDGVNDLVNCGNNSSLSFTNKLTIQIWCSLNVDSDYKSPLMKTTSINWNDGYGFYKEGGRFYFFINLWDGAHRVSVSRTTFSMTNFVGTYDGTNLKLYENGILMQTGSSFTSNVSNSATNLIIGNGVGDEDFEWNGNIAQVSIYNRALTASEILQNYNATKGRYGL